MNKLLNNKIKQILNNKAKENKILNISNSKKYFLKILNTLNKNQIEYTIKQNLLNIIIENINTDNVKNNLLSGKTSLGQLTYEKLANNIISLSYDDSLPNLMNNIIKNADIEGFTVIIERYRINDWQFCIRKLNDYNDEFIDIILPNNKKLINNFINDMKIYGFYPNIQTNFIDDYLKNNSLYKNKFIFIRFLPFTQENIRELLYNQKFIYHITYEQNIQNIKKYGLIPFNKTHPTYPKRIFLLMEPINKPIFYNIIIYRLLSKLLSYKLIQNNIPPNEFKKVIIDINKVPKNIEFFIDINSYPYAIYTNDIIPPSSIISIENININDNIINMAKTLIK